jgi:hypothetical protein
LAQLQQGNTPRSQVFDEHPATLPQRRSLQRDGCLLPRNLGVVGSLKLFEEKGIQNPSIHGIIVQRGKNTTPRIPRNFFLKKVFTKVEIPGIIITQGKITVLP